MPAPRRIRDGLHDARLTMPEERGRSWWRDRPAGYGWMSIALHWITGTIILTLLFIGDSISAPGGGDMVGRHTGLAITLYPLLVLRVVWRLRERHPGPSPRQRPRGFALGKFVHYSLLGALCALLASGPPMAWSGGFELRLFGRLLLPNPIGVHPELHAALLRVHATAATVLALLVAMHVCAVFKHLLVNKDETLERMMVAGEPGRTQA